MNEQYFSNNPQSQHQEKQLDTVVNGFNLKLITDSGVFSKDRVDYGSQRLVETFMEEKQVLKGQKILELGSGYGPIVITLAKAFHQASITAVELNERAYHLAQRNSSLNQVGTIQWLLDDATSVDLNGEVFDYVLTNPPIRAGKQTVHQFITHSYKQLKPGGSLWVVIQKKQGAPSLYKHMEDIFGNAEKVKQDKGYWILTSEKIV